MVPWRSSPRKRSALAPASFVDPCLPVLSHKAPSGPLWIHEIKHDGYRLQIHKRGPRVALYTMTGVDWTARFPWIVEGATAIKADAAIIDAEAIIADERGVSQFDKLGERIHDASAFAFAFDAMMIDGEDVRTLAIEERRARLAIILQAKRRVKSYAQSGIQLSEHLECEGPLAYAQACLLGLEGIVSKRRGSSYRSGKCKAWLKTKNPRSAAVLRIMEGGLS